MKLPDERKGASVTGGIFMTVVGVTIVLVLMGLSFSQIMTEGSTNYGGNYNESDLEPYNQASEIGNITQGMSDAFNTNSTTTGSSTINSFDTVFSIGLSLGRLAMAIPGVYSSMITAAGTSLGVPAIIITLVRYGLIIVVLGIFMMIVLGRMF